MASVTLCIHIGNQAILATQRRQHAKYFSWTSDIFPVVIHSNASHKRDPHSWLNRGHLHQNPECFALASSTARLDGTPCAQTHFSYHVWNHIMKGLASRSVTWKCLRSLKVSCSIYNKTWFYIAQFQSPEQGYYAILGLTDRAWLGL